jgi:hypothetical protein
MATMYSNSYVTIAATTGRDNHNGVPYTYIKNGGRIKLNDIKPFACMLVGSSEVAYDGDIRQYTLTVQKATANNQIRFMLINKG